MKSLSIASNRLSECSNSALKQIVEDALSSSRQTSESDRTDYYIDYDDHGYANYIDTNYEDYADYNDSNS